MIITRKVQYSVNLLESACECSCEMYDSSEVCKEPSKGFVAVIFEYP